MNLSLSELKQIQTEAEERRKQAEEEKKKQGQLVNVAKLSLHFEEDKNGLWLVVRAEVQANQTKKGNIALHNSAWRKVKTKEGIEVVIPSFNPFISMK